MVELQINDGSVILDNLWTNLINSGARTRRHDSSRTGLIFSAIATEINIALSLLQSYADQFTLSTATDRMIVENMASKYAYRRMASKSKVLLTFYRIGGFTDSVKINAGFAVKSSTAGNIIFKTAQDVYLWKGTQSVSVVAYSLNSGAKNNVPANTLTIFANNQFNGTIAVTNPEPSFGAYNDESINHLRNRANGFRYERDGTLQDITRQLYQEGVNAYRHSNEEFIDGPGTYMICIDTDSDYEFQDITTALGYRRDFGRKAVYVRAQKVYIDMYVTVQTARDINLTSQQKNSIYNSITDSVQKFFAAYCAVGSDVRLNSLKAVLNTNLSNFEIANIDIDIANTAVVNKQNVIPIGNTQKAVPNKVLTHIEFVGV